MKVNKRLEGFRVRNAPPGSSRHLLLPLSLGVSSLTLLHVLDLQSKRQIARTGRTGYALHVLCVLPSDSKEYEAGKLLVDKIQNRFPAHSYILKTLEDDSTPSQPASDSATSATSQADLARIRLTKLVVDAAKEADCEVVCWGDSTTRLAEKILAETAKGRGFALPWLVNDGETPFGVSFSFPVRDVLKKELRAFADCVTPPFSDLLADESTERSRSTNVSTKNMTIDSLMSDYFATVEESFPSIVANVVRTSGKLESPAQDRAAVVCESCLLPLQEGHLSLRAWGGQQTTVDATEEMPEPEADTNLCYACSRALLD